MIRPFAAGRRLKLDARSVVARGGLVNSTTYGVVAVLATAAILPARADSTSTPRNVFRCPSKTPAKEMGSGDPMWPLLATLVPYQRWSCLDGEVIGILGAFDGDIQPFGWMPSPRRAGRASGNPQFVFTVGVDSPRAVYFAPPSSMAEAMPLQVEDGDGKPYSAHSSSLPLADRSHVKLTADVNLVRVRVNADKGSRGGLHFITDRVEVLDGTPRFPLDASKLVHEVVDPLATTETREGRRWRSALDRALIDTARRDRTFFRFARAPVTEAYSAGHHVTWLPDRQVLRIVFYARLHRSRNIPNPAYNEGDDRQMPYGCKGRCAPRPAPPLRNFGYGQLAEYALEVEYSHTGKLISRREHQVRTGRQVSPGMK